MRLVQSAEFSTAQIEGKSDHFIRCSVCCCFFFLSPDCIVSSLVLSSAQIAYKTFASDTCVCKRRLIFVTDFLLHSVSSVSSLLIANQCWDSLQNFDKILINDKLFNIFYILTVISMFLSLYSYCYYATLMGKVTFEELPAKSQKTSSLPE